MAAAIVGLRALLFAQDSRAGLAAEGRRVASYAGLALALLVVSATACPHERATIAHDAPHHAATAQR